jgi:hypothetical protein
MILDTEALTTLVGVVYLLGGLSAFVSPAIFLMIAPKSELATAPFLDFLGTQILIFGPCFLIAYAWIRRRKWGRYLLIAYNGLWFALMAYLFVARMINYSEGHLILVVMSFLIILIVLGGLIAFAFQKDVQSIMSH